MGRLVRVYEVRRAMHERTTQVEPRFVIVRWRRSEYVDSCVNRGTRRSQLPYIRQEDHVPSTCQSDDGVQGLRGGRSSTPELTPVKMRPHLGLRRWPDSQHSMQEADPAGNDTG